MENPEQESSDAISNVVLTCLKILLSDEAWQDIGFAGRRRIGALFQRIRPAWETAYRQQIMAS